MSLAEIKIKSPIFCCCQQVYDIFNMSCLGVILQVRVVMAYLHRRMVRLHTHSLMYLPGWFPVAFPAVFIFLQCPSPMAGPPKLQRLSCDLTVFSQQPASDADSTCPACKTLPGYSYLVTAPWLGATR